MFSRAASHSCGEMTGGRSMSAGSLISASAPSVVVDDVERAALPQTRWRRRRLTGLLLSDDLVAEVEAVGADGGRPVGGHAGLGGAPLAAERAAQQVAV